MTYTRSGLAGRIQRSTCDTCHAVASQHDHQYGRAVLSAWEARHTCPTAAGAVVDALGEGRRATASAETGGAA